MEDSLYSPVRACFLDELRGLAIILMVAHHAAWDLHWLFGANIALLTHPVTELLRTVFSAAFVFISGMVCNTSRSNRKRGVVTLACGLVITFITRLVLPQMPIRFGVLHLLGICMLLYSLLEGRLKQYPTEWGLVVTLILFALGWNLPNGFIGGAKWVLVLPQGWYSFDLGYVFGLPQPGFSSSDYFPLVPWAFLFFAGSFLGRRVFALRSPGWLFQSRVPPLAWVGRRTLLIYLLHQPLLFGIMQLILQ